MPETLASPSCAPWPQWQWPRSATLPRHCAARAPGGGSRRRSSLPRGACRRRPACSSRTRSFRHTRRALRYAIRKERKILFQLRCRSPALTAGTLRNLRSLSKRGNGVDGDDGVRLAQARAAFPLLWRCSDASRSAAGDTKWGKRPCADAANNLPNARSGGHKRSSEPNLTVAPKDGRPSLPPEPPGQT